MQSNLFDILLEPKKSKAKSELLTSIQSLEHPMTDFVLVGLDSWTQRILKTAERFCRHQQVMNTTMILQIF